MLIAVDAMGGDDAPRFPVAGAVATAREHGTRVLLVGDESRIRTELKALGVGGELDERLEIVHAEQVVGMDEPAITPIRRKRRSSIRICAELVREGRAQAMVSAGNTGAAMISAKMVIGVAAGVDRPALAATLPNRTGKTIVVDVGANIDSKARHLQQFAVMGHFFAQEIVGVGSPRIGLLSIGEEEGKGTDFTREAFKAIESTGLNFVGNVEGRDVFTGTVDVVVCDGFVGNVLLKSAESLAEMVGTMLREEIEQRLIFKLGYLMLRPAFAQFRRRTDYSEYGGAPLLGIRGGCFIAHGSSTPKAIKNAILRAVEFCEAGIDLKVSEKLTALDLADEEALDPQEEASRK